MDPSKDTCACPYLLAPPSPHKHEAFNPIHPKIYGSALEIIGNTPMVRLNKIPVEEGKNKKMGLIKINFSSLIFKRSG
jgi:hypothetical protein